VIAWWQAASWFVFGSIVARYWCYRIRGVHQEDVTVSASKQRPGFVRIELHQFGHTYDFKTDGATQIAAAICRVIQTGEKWKREGKP